LGLPQLRRADLGDVDLVVNTTPVGLENQRLLAVPYASTPKESVFFDLIPRSQTPFLRAAKRARRQTVDGTGMLLHQGAAALELWTGQEAPVDVMRRALKAALHK
jgi:shikimate dehydrogenase